MIVFGFQLIIKPKVKLLLIVSADHSILKHLSPGSAIELKRPFRELLKATPRSCAIETGSGSVLLVGSGGAFFASVFFISLRLLPPHSSGGRAFQLCFFQLLALSSFFSFLRFFNFAFLSSCFFFPILTLFSKLHRLNGPFIR